MQKWWQRGIIYQIYPRSFKDTNGDGIGDLQGIIEKLDYLNNGTETSLGIDAIWISPFYPSPMADFGYDVANYVDVDPMFGDLATFDRLVAEAHQRGMKVIVDYVPNHSSDEHEWFKESRSSRDNPKRDWYIWKDAKADGSPPNNWGSMFGGSAWTWDTHTQQYYFHQFDPKQPDLNWRNPEVRKTMYDVLRFWMQRGVDGFRMDVIYIVWKHPDMPDQPLVDGTGRGEADIFARQQQIYAFNYAGVHDIMAEIHAVLAEKQAFGVGEIWLSLEERMKYHAEDYIPFNFDLLDGDLRFNWQAELFKAKVEAYEALVPEGAMPNYVMGSHDQPRLASRYGGSEARARVAALMLLTLRGIPTIYMGEELGMLNGEIKPEEMQDPQGLNLGVEHTRDVCRTPIQWDASPYAGFSTVTTWLPVHSDYQNRNAEKLNADEQSILALYRRLIWYRKNHEALISGSYRSLPSPANTYVYLRELGDERYLIALNFSGETVEIDLPSDGEIVMNTFLNASGRVSDTLFLVADEGVLLKLL